MADYCSYDTSRKARQWLNAVHVHTTKKMSERYINVWYATTDLNPHKLRQPRGQLSNYSTELTTAIKTCQVT